MLSNRTRIGLAITGLVTGLIGLPLAIYLEDRTMVVLFAVFTGFFVFALGYALWIKRMFDDDPPYQS